MICSNCGNEIADGVKFCPNCGNPVTGDVVQPAPMPAPEPIRQQSSDSYVQPPQPEQQSSDSYVQPPQGYQAPQGYVQPPQGQGYQQQQYTPYDQPQKKSKAWIIILVVVLAIVALLVIAGIAIKRAADRAVQDLNDQINTELDDIDLDDLDIDLDALNSEIEEMTNNELDQLDLDPDSIPDSDTTSSDSGESYDYVDVTYSGNTVKIAPNGNLDGSTVLYGGKDLEGLCDYIDDYVLEEGRYINRDMLYDLIAIDVVDDSLWTDFEDIELNMIMACALANNFHNLDVRVTDCVIDSANPTDYKYDVVAEGRDDTWIINYKDKTVYFNNGATEYSSDMFKDEYLAVWMTGIEEYYGIEAD